MEHQTTGLYLVPTFSPPVICPRLMSTHQRLQMMFDVTLEGPESAPALRATLAPSSGSSSNRKHVFVEPNETSKIGGSKEEEKLNLFEGALSYTPKATEENEVPRSTNTKSTLVQQHKEKPFEKPIEEPKARKRDASLTALLSSAPTKKQKTSSNTAESSTKVKGKAVEETSAQHLETHAEQASWNKPSMAPTRQVSARTTSTVREPRFESSEIVIEDFKGIQSVCKNAGASIAGLSALYKLCSEAKFVHLTLLFHDLSCNHAPSTVKYCKPSSRCDLWYCSCDKVIRASKLKDALLAVLITLPDGKDSFLLPLITCIEPTPASPAVATGLFEKMISSSSSSSSQRKKPKQIFPFKCQTNLQQRLEFFMNLLQDGSITKVLFHSQAALLSIYGLSNNTSNQLQLKAIFDPKIAAYLLNSDITEDQLELYELLTFYHLSLGNTEDVVDLGKMTRILQKIAKEARQSLILYQKMGEELVRHSLVSLFWEIEMPLTYSLSLMEFCGVHVIPTTIEETGNLLKTDSEVTEKEIYQLTGFKFNVASPDQVSEVLYDRLKILEQKKNIEEGDELIEDTSNTAKAGGGGGGKQSIRIQKKQRHLSTSEEELKKVSHLHPVIDKILHFRAVNKLLSTYIDGLNPFIVNTTENTSGLLPSIHAIWNQTAVRTGRLSCCKPNMQNIPSSTQNTNITDKEGKPYIINIRNFFTAKPGFVFLAADYSQIEVRILAHVCQDAIMMELFQNEKDIYRQLAGKILNQPVLELVPDSERNKAKTICLGILYGMGAASAAQKLGIEVYQAQHIINSFYQKFQQVKRWMEGIRSHTKETKLIRTLAGRVRHLPDIVSQDSFKRSAAERQAINSIIQGSASDIIKYGMVCMERLLQSLALPVNHPSQSLQLESLSEVMQTTLKQLTDQQRQMLARCSLVMQIHDELIFEIPDDSETSALFIVLLREIMEKEVMRRFRFSVPLRTNISMGGRWGDLTAVKACEPSEVKTTLNITEAVNSNDISIM